MNFLEEWNFWNLFISSEYKSSFMCPLIIHSAVTLPAPPELAIPMLLKPQHVNKFETSGVSPNKYWVSGVNDSGPEKNFLIPAFSNMGSLLNDFC